MQQNPRLNIVTFASWRYEGGRRRLLRSIEQHSPARCWNFSPKDFTATALYRGMRRTARAPRGAGYWLWKPHYVVEVLKQIAEGDLLVYLDAGFELNAGIEPLLKLVSADPGVALFRVHGRLNRHWTKRDCFVLMGCDTPRFLDVEQSMSGIIVIRKNAVAVRLMCEWLACVGDSRTLTDAPNTCGLPNYPGFTEHRHDQSILTNLAIRHGIPTYTDPSQFGDAFRGDAIPGVDDYPALLNLHRERAPSWRTALRLLRNDRSRFVRATSRHISRIARSATS